MGNCDGLEANECETNLRTDSNHCGGCGLLCNLKNATAECSGGKCRILECIAPFEDCDGEPENGCEVNTKTDAQNCGACGELCVDINGQPYCAESVCEIVCDVGFGDCDDKRSNGCEKDVSSDVQNCGGCGEEGEVCSATSGNTPWCRDGSCGETKCPSGFGDCNGNPDDGCETDLRTDANNCGTCGNLCVAANGTAYCNDTMCAIQSCNPGYDDCSGGYADGCETNLNTNAAHCGGCGTPCTIDNGQPLCDVGECTVKSCNANYDDCNGLASDGCEINLSMNQTNCGMCGNNCTTAFANASGTCSASTCSLTTCNVGYGNCNQIEMDGCETNTTSARLHCGGCGKECLASTSAHVSSNSCSASTCNPVCNSGYANCDGDGYNGCEANTANTRLHCGGCGLECSSAASAHVSTNNCSGSSCNPSCTTGYGNCDADGYNGCETDTTTSRLHCGGCGQECSIATSAHVTSNTCSSGDCNPACMAGYANCDDTGHNGCEANTATSRLHCGGCGQECSIAASAHVTSNNCSGSKCSPQCTNGYANCDGDAYDGCETDTNTSRLSCGGCGQVCSIASGAHVSSNNCSNGTCSPVCNSGFGNCDGDSYDGCETDTNSTRLHCGGCNKECSIAASAHVTSNSCSSGSCNPVCASGYLDCDGNSYNGCEAQLNSRLHCGGCNKECSIAASAHVTSNDCSSGTCSPECATGYANCDGNAYNGCETQLGTSSHCLSCGNSCSGSTPVCSASGCVAGCATPFSKAQCLNYGTGSTVSLNGRNYTCANDNCRNCDAHTSCEPGQTGCPWGVVWTDNGVCQ
jgi:hypothetical protein